MKFGVNIVYLEINNGKISYIGAGENTGVRKLLRGLKYLSPTNGLHNNDWNEAFNTWQNLLWLTIALLPQWCILKCKIVKFAFLFLSMSPNPL